MCLASPSKLGFDVSPAHGRQRVLDRGKKVEALPARLVYRCHRRGRRVCRPELIFQRGDVRFVPGHQRTQRVPAPLRHAAAAAAAA